VLSFFCWRLRQPPGGTVPGSASCSLVLRRLQSGGHCFWQAGKELLQVGLVNIFSFCDGVRVVLSTSDMLPTFSGNDRFHKIFSQKNPFDLVHHINSRINVIQFMLLIKKVIKRPLHLVLALF
jgi:hypothetical protein